MTLYIIINNENNNIILNNNIYKINKIKDLLLICKISKSTDIILFINEYNTAILKNDSEINRLYQEYKSKGKKLIFSKAKTPINFYEKYLIDKLNKRYNGYQINPNLFIGDVKSINKLFSNISLDNIHNDIIDKIKNKSYIDVDSDNKIFYNYSYVDKYKKLDPLIISGINPNIKSNLLKININQNNNKIRLEDNILELLFLIFGIFLLLKIKNKLIGLLLIITIFFELIHYQLYVKHVKREIYYKILYCIFDFFHIAILNFAIYLSLNIKNDIKYLFMLNILYFFIIFQFFIFKKCSLTIIENKILGIDSDCGAISRVTRLMYFKNINSSYLPKKGHNLERWINGNKITIVILIIINLIYYLKLIYISKRL